MKNSNRILFIAIFILIGLSLGFSPYKIESPSSDNPHIISLLGDLGNRNKLLVLFISILSSIPTLFLPAVIVILSFYWRLKFKRTIKLAFSVIFLIALSLNTMLLLGTSISFFKVQYTPTYWLMHIWNFSGALWALLLALPFKKRIPLIHWPFDERDSEE